MKPEQFIREFGVEKAREVVASGSDTFTFVFKDGVRDRHKSVSVSGLKRLVESLDLIKLMGGISEVKRKFRDNGSCHGGRMKALIADHESIYGGGENA